LHSLVGTLHHTIQIQCHQIELLAIVEINHSSKGILRGQPISVY
jgi:hypothetical protein